MSRKKETKKLFFVLFNIEAYTDEDTIIEFYNADGVEIGEMTYVDVATVKPSLYDKQVIVTKRTPSNNELKIQFIEQL